MWLNVKVIWTLMQDFGMSGLPASREELSKKNFFLPRSGYSQGTL